MLVDLQNRLKEHTGKKVYGYLSKDDKCLVDRIVDEIGKIPAVKELYDLWYEKQYELHRIYSENIPIQLPLSQNPEFKSIRNAVIKSALGLGNNTDDERIKLFPTEDDDIWGIDVSEDEHQSKTLYPSSFEQLRVVSVKHKDDPVYVTKSVTGLLNSISKIFRDKFNDNPDHVARVDIKLRRKILEKEEAHGIKHG